MSPLKVEYSRGSKTLGEHTTDRGEWLAVVEGLGTTVLLSSRFTHWTPFEICAPMERGRSHANGGRLGSDRGMGEELPSFPDQGLGSNRQSYT